MELVFRFKSEAIEKLLHRIKQLSLAYKEKVDQRIEKPIIVDGSKKYEGLTAMNEYIDQLDREKEKWYYCDC